MLLVTAADAYLCLPGPSHGPIGLLIDGARISDVGHPSRFAGYLGDRLDLGTVTMMPGLIDAHVHLAFDGGDDPVGVVQRTGDDALVTHMRRAAGELLAAGVTTARDLGSRGLLDVTVRESVRRGETPGPDLLLACRPLTTPGGHCWFFGGECADLGELLDAVRLHADSGADWIKLVVSGGFLTDGTIPASPQFDVETLTSVVELAHDRGLRVAAHAHSTVAIEISARAGVDTVEHATFLAPGGVDYDRDVCRMLIDNGVAVCPTANAESYSYPDDSGPDALARLVELHADGLRLIAGTDAGVRHVPPGAYVAGLQTLARAGLGTEAILAAATAASAEVLGLKTGRLAPGCRADLLAVAGDPLADLSVLADPLWIMASGAVAAR